MRFELSKWYADCATERGDALILYSAELRWRGPAIHYTSLLAHRPDCPAQSRFSLRKQPPPEADGGRIEWHSRAWEVNACWTVTGGSVRELLFDSPAGSVEWRCVAPRAAAEVRTGSEVFSGLGYVEHLRLSIPPWRLPISRLRWGRFISPTDFLVWIDWCGAYNRRVLYLNGATERPDHIGDGEIVLAGCDAVLSLDRGAVLREGALGATALSVLPDLDRLFPASILNIRERKWLSRGVLRRCGRPDSVGMAIHEVVEWP